MVIPERCSFDFGGLNRSMADTIKAVIFDFGNVIATFDNDLILQKFSKNSGHSVEEMRQRLYYDSTLPKEYETGLISSYMFYVRVSMVCGLSMSQKEFSHAYSEKFTIIPQTLKLLRKLGQQPLTLGLLSNTSAGDYQIGIAPIIKGIFDTETLSFKVGAMKPAFRIYNDMLGKIGHPPHECAYIDDIAAYADEATALGMHGITYTTPGKLEHDLKALGVKF